MKKLLLTVTCLLSLASSSFASENAFVSCDSLGSGTGVDFVDMSVQNGRFPETKTIITKIGYMDESVDVYETKYVKEVELYAAVRMQSVKLTGRGIGPTNPKYVNITIDGENIAVNGRGLNFNGGFNCKWLEI